MPSIQGNCYKHIFRVLAQTHLFCQIQIFRLFKKGILKKYKMLSVTISQSKDFKILCHFKKSPDKNIFLLINKGKKQTCFFKKISNKPPD